MEHRPKTSLNSGHIIWIGTESQFNCHVNSCLIHEHRSDVTYPAYHKKYGSSAYSGVRPISVCRLVSVK